MRRIAVLGVTAAAISVCPDEKDTLETLLRKLPELRQDLRRHLPGLLKQHPGSQDVLWNDCSWAETLCQLRLPKATRLIVLSPTLGLPLTAAESDHLLLPVGPSEGNIWIDLPLERVMLSVGSCVVWAHAGGTMYSDSCQAVIAVPRGQSECREPFGFKAPFAVAASWAYAEVAQNVRREWQGSASLRALNYATTNLFLAVKGLEPLTHSDFNRTETLDSLGYLSWRWVELSALPANTWTDPFKTFEASVLTGFVKELRRQLSWHLVQNPNLPPLLPLYPRKVLAPKYSAPRHLPVAFLNTHGIEVPLVGLQISGGSALQCSEVAYWAISLRVEHFHLNGSAECLEAVGNVLASQDVQPFISVVVDIQSDVTVELIIQHLQRTPDLLVATDNCAGRCEYLNRHGVLVYKLTLNNMPHDWIPDICSWTLYNPSRECAESVIIELHTVEDNIALDSKLDPHVLSIASDVGRSPSSVLLRYHLQQGRAVLLEMPGSKQDLHLNLQLNFSLSFAHMERIRALPTLVEGIAGVSLKAVEVLQLPEILDLYGLGTAPAVQRLAPIIEETFHSALNEAIATWRALPCMQPSACTGMASAVEMAECLLSTSSGVYVATPKDVSTGFEEHPVSAKSNLEEERQVAIGIAYWDWSQTLMAYTSSLPSLRAAFFEARPRRVVIDGFLPQQIFDRLAMDFHEQELCAWLSACNDGNLRCSLDPSDPNEFMRSERRHPEFPSFLAVHRFVQSDSFVTFLQQLSGIEALRPFEKSGSFVETRPPGYLAIHEDSSFPAARGAGGFNPHKDQRLARLNMLLFLNDLEFPSGSAEFWDMSTQSGLPTAPVVQITPRQNRLLIWDVVDGMHGLPWPLRGEQSRRALQWYFVQGESTTGSHIKFYNVPCTGDCYLSSDLV